MGVQPGGTALDTSIIIPALLGWDEHHQGALPVVQEALAAKARVFLPLPAPVEVSLGEP